MTDREPIEVANLDRYGNDVLPWSRAHDLLAAPAATREAAGDRPSYLATCRPDGRPHLAGIGALWYDGDLWFTSGLETRKSRNLAENPACAIAMSLEGLDLILEGDAALVSDRATLESVAALYRDDGWPVRVEGDAFVAPYSAPAAGPPPWRLYRLRFHTAFGTATAEPHGATRWRFAS
jgi:hypothetical protein